MLETVLKTGQILDFFTADRPEWGVTEMSVAMRMPKTTLHGLLASMVEVGWLERTLRRRYRMNWAIVRYGRQKMAASRFADEVSLGLLELFNKHHTTFYCVSQYKNRLVLIDALRDRRYAEAYRAVSAAEHIRDLRATIAGQVLLAFFNQNQIQLTQQNETGSETSLLMPETQSGLPPLPIAMDPALAALRLQGYGETETSEIPGWSSIAVPIIGLPPDMVFALVATVPVARFALERDRLRSSLLQLARTASQNP